MKFNKMKSSLILKNTLNDLINDLKTNCQGVDVTSLEKILKDMGHARLLLNIKNPDSDLCKCIPVDILKSSKEGQKYLEILAHYQPMFKSLDKGGKDNINLEDIINKIPDDFKEIFTPNDKNSDVLNVVSDLFQDIDLQELSSDPNNGIKVLFENVTSKIESIESGQLENFSSQLLDMFSQLSQNSQLQELIMSAPEGTESMVTIFSEMLNNTNGTEGIGGMFSQLAQLAPEMLNNTNTNGTEGKTKISQIKKI